MKRVVITGLGALSSLGDNPKDLFDSLIANKSGIKKITRFDTSEFDVKVAGQIDNFDPEKQISKRLLKRFDLYSTYGVYVALQAHKDAGLEEGNFDPYRYGCIVSSGAGGIITYQEGIQKSIVKLAPLTLPKALPNMLSGNAAIEVNAKGKNLCIITACASGTHSIGEGFNLIQAGDADLVLAGASDAALTEIGIGGFQALRALSTSQDPTKASRPFDKDRDGFVMGEGAAAVVLEELDHALARGAKIYAEVIGYGATCDASHMTNPTTEGPARSMQQALNKANITVEEIKYINAHGTSTPINDTNETKAIHQVFKEHAKNLKVSSIKGAIGHTLGAAGALEAVVSALSLENDIFPGTPSSNGDDPTCDLDYMINGSEKIDTKYVLSNSFGFGGHNGTLIFKKWEGK